MIKTLAERISGAVRRIELEDSLESYYEQLEEMVKERTRDLEKAQEQLTLLSNTVKSSFDGITLADMEGIAYMYVNSGTAYRISGEYWTELQEDHKDAPNYWK